MRIGVFGGTFDPIHNAHLILAVTALEQLHLDQVRIVVAGQPQLKKAPPIATAEQRLTMVELAIRGIPGVFADRTELEHPGPSFTVQTLRSLRQRFPADQLILLLGRDSALQLERWREPEEIRRLADIAVCGRGDQAAPEGFSLSWSMPAMAISSTAIRQRSSAGLSLAGWVPERVGDYIAGLRIYGSCTG